MDNILNNNFKIVRFNNLPLDGILTTTSKINLNSKWRSYADSTGSYMYPRDSSTPPHSIIFPYTISYARLIIFYIGAASTPTITINTKTFNVSKKDTAITLKTRTNQLDCTFSATASSYCVRTIIYS